MRELTDGAVRGYVLGNLLGLPPLALFALLRLLTGHGDWFTAIILVLALTGFLLAWKLWRQLGDSARCVLGWHDYEPFYRIAESERFPNGKLKLKAAEVDYRCSRCGRVKT